MKIAVTGKGGVGKTTLTALLASLWAEEKQVTVVDADPSMNLALALGVPGQIREKIVPLSEMKELIEERTGSSGSGGFFKLNPKVDDLSARLAISHGKMRLIVMGTIKEGGGGCACAENVLLKAFLSHLFLEPEEVLIVDMEAGLEPLGRRTVQSVDALLVVVEPGQRSIEVGQRIKKMASDIGLNRVFFVVNKVPHDIVSQSKEADAKDAWFYNGLKDTFGKDEWFVMPASEDLAKADMQGISPYLNLNGEMKQHLKRLKEALEQGIAEK